MKKILFNFNRKNVFEETLIDLRSYSKYEEVKILKCF